MQHSLLNFANLLWICLFFLLSSCRHVQREPEKFSWKGIGQEVLVAGVEEQNEYFLSKPVRQLRFTKLGTRDGLSSNAITCLAQDGAGYLWIGTAEGLNQYDGKTCRVFLHKERDTNSIPGNFIETLYCSSDNRVWGVAGYLFYYNPATGKFVTLQAKPGNNHFPPVNNITGFYQEDSVSLWMTTMTDGYLLIRYDLQKGIFEEILKKDFPGHWSRNAERGNWGGITGDKRGNLYFDHDGLILRLQTRTRQIDSVGVNYNGHVLVMDGQGNLWADANYGIRKFNTEYGRVEHYFPEALKTDHLDILAMTVKSGSDFWIGTQGKGTWLFHSEEGRFELFDFSGVEFSFSKSTSVSSILRDRQGIFWFGTVGGLLKLDPSRNRFHQRGPIERSWQPERQKLGISKTVYNRFDRHWYFIAHYATGLGRMKADGLTYSFTRHDPPESAHSFQDMLVDEQGTVWFTGEGKLFALSPGDEQYRIINPDAGLKTNRSGFGIMMLDRQQQLWIEVRNSGVIRMDPVTLKGRYYSMEELTGNSSSGHARPVQEDRSGNIWFLQDYAVFRFHPETGDRKMYSRVFAGMETSDSSTIDHFGFGAGFYNMAVDSMGMVWIAYFQHGLLQFDPAADTVHLYTQIGDQQLTRLKDIQADRFNRLWLVSDFGLWNLDPASRAINSFTSDEGLYTGDAISSITITGDTLVTGYWDGVLCYAPLSFLKADTYVPVLEITSIQAGDERNKRTFFPDEFNHLRFDHASNLLTIRFSSPDLSKPSGTLFSYKLSGIEKDWRDPVNLGQAVYTHLPPGDYQFLVKRVGQGVERNEKPASLGFRIEPAWWQTWWFKLILVMAALLLFYFFYRFRTLQLKRLDEQHLFREQLKDLELMALHAQMNPHFIFNCINSIQHYILKKESKEAVKYLQKFARLIRGILDNSQKKTVTLEEETALLDHYMALEALRFDHQFDYLIELDEELEVQTTEIPTMIIQPFVENAILHGLKNKEGRGQLTVGLYRDNQRLKCIIQDNGVGREQAARLKGKSAHKSKGIQITVDRIRLLNKLYSSENSVLITDLYEPGGLPAGTRVELFIPLS